MAAAKPYRVRLATGRFRCYSTPEAARHAKRASWAARRERVQRRARARRAAQAEADRAFWASLHPEQQRAWTRIRRHLDRAPGSFAWRDIRRAFYGQHRQCFYCGDGLEGSTPSAACFHIEHIHHGGSNRADNLCLACPACNREKGAAPFHDYIQSRRRRGLPAPSRDQEFPLLDMPERLAAERARRATAMMAPTDPWERPMTVVRRRPKRGKAWVGESRQWTPIAPSRKAKATGEAMQPKGQQ